MPDLDGREVSREQDTYNEMPESPEETGSVNTDGVPQDPPAQEGPGAGDPGDTGEWEDGGALFRSTAITEEELERLKSLRRERYTENRHAEGGKQLNKYVMLGLMGLIFAYFVAAFVLNLAGAISKLTMFLMLSPVLAAIIAAYLINRSRNG